jgi:cation-transporting ATPase F
VSSSEAVRDAAPQELPVDELLVLLETDLGSGLSTDEARRRLQEYGPNELPHVAATGPVIRLLRQMHNPLIYVLLVSGAVTVFLGEYVDAAVILGVVLVNTVVGFVQESRAESALDALRSLVRTEARVLRDGAQRLMPSTELVPGDVVLVEAGDKLPADLRLVAHAELQSDESALTGESVPVAKDESTVPVGTQMADRHDMLYSGTFVTSGTGSGVVVATGADTELGEIHRLVGSAKGLATPLTRKLARFSGFLTLAILVLAGLTFAIGIARGEPAAEMFTASVALAVGAIPEGLPAAVTVTLAIGVSRMARRGAVIRRLPAAETLGGATVICTDKTGTLTENRMTVLQLWTPQGMRSTEHPDAPLTEAERWTLVVGANCNDSRLDGDTGVGDPTETAMLVVAAAHGVPPHELPRLAELPFSSDRQYMATTHADPASGETVLLVKGGVERVLALCDRQMGADGTPVPLAEHAVDSAVRDMAADGMRVLATAVGADRLPTDLGELADRRDLVLTGLHAMLDPPRHTAADAVRSCRTAGLAVKMITGDHAATAEAIARQVGVLDDDGGDAVLTGDELRALPDADLPDAVERAAVFARVTPEQKLRLVEALQARDHVVAMTGDGVNDAPALKQADIGIAMGLGGTEVAKEAGDMVLTDDDFATIEAAVEEGRGVFDNLTKFIVWTLPTNTGEALVILVAIVLGATLPILPTQILWINMTTAVALGLTLAWEPREPGIMTRPPRDPRRSLLTGPVLFRTLLVSVLLTAGAWWVFELEGAAGASVEASRTAAVNVFVMAQLFYLFSCRSLDVSVWRIGLFSNRVLLVGVAVQLLLQALFTYLPAMNALFDTAPIGIGAWGRIILVAAAVTSVAALDKRRVRGRLLT